VLTSTISPEIGEFISLVALTLSTAPKPEFLDTAPPGSGSSTNTTSPRWSCNYYTHSSFTQVLLVIFYTKTLAQTSAQSFH